MSLKVKTAALSRPNRCCYCNDEILPEDLHIDPTDNSSYHLECEAERKGKGKFLEDRIKIKSLIANSRKFREDQIEMRAQEAESEINSLAYECLQYYNFMLNAGLKKVPTSKFDFVLDETDAENFAMYHFKEINSYTRYMYVYHLGSVIQNKSIEEVIEEEVKVPIKKEEPSQENMTFFKRIHLSFLQICGLKKVEYEIRTIQRKVTRSEEYVAGKNCSIGVFRTYSSFEKRNERCKEMKKKCEEQFTVYQEKSCIPQIAKGHYESKTLAYFEKQGELDNFVQKFMDERDYLKEHVELLEVIFELEDPKEQLDELQALFGRDEFQ